MWGTRGTPLPSTSCVPGTVLGAFQDFYLRKSHSQLLRCAIHRRVNRCLERLSDLSKVTQSGRAEI